MSNALELRFLPGHMQYLEEAAPELLALANEGVISGQKLLEFFSMIDDTKKKKQLLDVLLHAAAQEYWQINLEDQLSDLQELQEGSSPVAKKLIEKLKAKITRLENEADFYTYLINQTEGTVPINVSYVAHLKQGIQKFQTERSKIQQELSNL